MAYYVTSDDNLTAIADAIREKGGTVEELEFPNEFISAIEVISTELPTQTKSATPSESAQVIEPDEGHTLSEVTVAAIPSNYGLITWNGTTLTVS